MSHARLSACLVAVAIAIAIPLRAQTTQTRPNFLGKWTVVIEKSIPATPDRHGREITIAQDGQMLTLTQFAFRSTGVASITPGGVPSFSSPPTREEYQYSTTYDCDGTEHTTPQDALMTPAPPRPLPPGAVMVSPITESVYRAIWTRDQLVIVTRRTTTYRVRISTIAASPEIAALMQAASEKRVVDAAQSKARSEAERLRSIRVSVSSNLSLENVRVAGTVVSGTIVNTGAKTLRKVTVRVYFLDKSGRRIGEKDFWPVLVTDFSMGDDTPLRPGYRKDFSYSIEDAAPSEWSKQIECEIVDLEFLE